MTKEQFSKIVNVIAESFGITTEELLSYKKTSRVTMARHTLYRNITFMGYNLSETGDLLNRDHATVRHGLMVYKNVRETDEMFRIKTDNIRQKIKQIANEE